MSSAMNLGDKSTFREESDTRIDVRRFRLVVVECPDQVDERLKRGQTWESTEDKCAIGSNPRNDFVLEERSVSRFHCEIQIDTRGPRIRDLGSSNGTTIDGLRIESAFLKHGSTLGIGGVMLRFELVDRSNRLLLSERTEFGSLVSLSIAMRTCFALMERAALCDATVVLEGETGTGKSTAAKAIHDASVRHERPFMVADCGALVSTLIEAELFGHEKDAFTGAHSRRKGIFEEADGGTIFLDEIGELPWNLQHKLLRVLEEGEVRRVGGTTSVPVNVRIIAATNKDLRTETNAGRFRADLYYRLAVLRIRLPALRERPEDISMLVNRLLDKLRSSEHVKAQIRTPDFINDLRRSAWPGNIRELRNHLERCIALESPDPPDELSVVPTPDLGIDATRRFEDEKERIQMAFEREYLQKLMKLHGGNVTRAAEGAGLTRQYLHRLLKEHKIHYE